MNRNLILWSITVALGGFLFGMDVAVISGAEQVIQKLWNLSGLMHGTAIAIALYGTVVGAIIGSFPANRFGRKKTLLWIGIIFLVSSIGAAIANDVYTFMVFRFFGGFAIGASSVVAPIYISEIAPPKYRGRMGIAFQLNIVAGILFAYLSNYLLQGVGGENDWRYMLGVVAIPSLLFSIFMLFTPESPRWLILYRNNEEEARKIFTKSGANADELVHEVKNSVQQKRESLFSGKFNRYIMLAFLIAFFNQLSGINAIIYFAPRVFNMAGLEKSSAFLSSVGIGVVNFIFTLVGWYLIDRLGRRTLLFIGSIGYIISLSLIAFSFSGDSHDSITWFVFLFIAAHAVGQGAVIWVFISEIFPNSVRAAGMSLGSLTHWLFAALISQTFTFFAESPSIGPTMIFAFFAGMMVLQLLFVWKLMPETKGIALEDMNTRVGH
ncbi:MAG TPA: sugar porter family MFS transporter [Chitinophagaceae bacterium]|nr:sugar porter family MFS transporter [Chitinophagaceae bacterium]